MNVLIFIPKVVRSSLFLNENTQWLRHNHKNYTNPHACINIMNKNKNFCTLCMPFHVLFFIFVYFFPALKKMTWNNNTERDGSKSVSRDKCVHFFSPVHYGHVLDILCIPRGSSRVGCRHEYPCNLQFCAVGSANSRNWQRYALLPRKMDESLDSHRDKDFCWHLELKVWQNSCFIDCSLRVNGNR